MAAEKWRKTTKITTSSLSGYEKERKRNTLLVQ